MCRVSEYSDTVLKHEDKLCSVWDYSVRYVLEWYPVGDHTLAPLQKTEGNLGAVILFLFCYEVFEVWTLVFFFNYRFTVQYSTLTTRGSDNGSMENDVQQSSF